MLPVQVEHIQVVAQLPASCQSQDFVRGRIPEIEDITQFGIRLDREEPERRSRRPIPILSSGRPRNERPPKRGLNIVPGDLIMVAFPARPHPRPQADFRLSAVS